MKKQLLPTTYYPLLTVLVLLTTYYLLPTVAVANAASAGLGVTKSIMDLQILAGDSETQSIGVINNSTSTPLPVHVGLEIWDLREDSDDIKFVRTEDSLNATKWFDVSEKDFILNPKNSKSVEFTISPPVDTPPGSYFVIMRFIPSFPDFYFDKQGPRFIPEIGTLFFIRVPLLGVDENKNLYSADIESLEPEGSDVPFVSNFVPRANANVFDSAVRKLIAKIKNDGIYHFKMSGSIEIKNTFGRTVVSENLPERFLLPGRTRNIDIAVLPPPNLEGLSKFQKLIEKIGYKFRTNVYFGPYKATAILVVPESNLPVVKSVNFWVIPWKFAILTAFIVFVLLLVVRKIKGEGFISRVKTASRVLFRKRTYPQ